MNNRKAFAEAAREIAAKPSPELITNLRDCGKHILAYHEGEQLLPKRAPTRKALSAIQAAAVTLRRALSPTLIHFMDNAKAEGTSFDYQELVRILIEVEERAEATAKAIPVGQGRRRAEPLQRGTPAHSVSARELAALVVIVAWKNERGVAPGPDLPAAQRAAELLWLASTGRYDSGWRDHLMTAGQLARTTDRRRGLVADVEKLLRRATVPGV
jgi:hypothetical protein